MKKSFLYIVLISLFTILVETPVSAIENEYEFISRQRSRSESEERNEREIEIDIETDEIDSSDLKVGFDKSKLVTKPSLKPLPLTPVFIEPVIVDSAPEVKVVNDTNNSQGNDNTSTSVEHTVTRTKNEDGNSETTVTHTTTVETKNKQVTNEFTSEETKSTPTPTPEPLIIDVVEYRDIEIQEVGPTQNWYSLPNRINQVMVNFFNKLF